jgi:hypothetical protein
VAASPAAGLPADSILDAELAAARAFVDATDLERHRVAIVSFSGPKLNLGLASATAAMHGNRLPIRPSDAARVDLPLSSDRAAIEASLEQVRARGPHGLTYMAAGLQLATAELVGGPGALSRRDPTRPGLVVFLTDGAPTLPYSHHQRRNEAEVLREADRAARYSLPVVCLAVGPEALAGPLACVEMADRTGGRFVAVRHPGALPEVLAELSYVGIADLRVRNLTTSAGAIAVRLAPDGSWEALVPLAPGRNELEVAATADDGATGRAAWVIERRDDATGPAVPAALFSRRGRILEAGLDHVRRERRRLELLAELRREQDAARALAAQHRRELELELEGSPD